METVAFSLTVPSLALKMPNGLDGMTLSPPGARLPLHYLETDLDDSFTVEEEEEELRKGASIKKKLQSKLAQNRQRQKESEILKVQEHFSPHPAPSQLQPLSLQEQQMLVQPVPTSLKSTGLTPSLTCTSPQPQNTSLPVQGTSPVMHTLAQTRILSNKRPLSAPPLSTDPPRSDKIQVTATALPTYSSCVSRLQRLMKLCTQKRQLETDLFPHLGKSKHCHESVNKFKLQTVHFGYSEGVEPEPDFNFCLFLPLPIFSFTCCSDTGSPQ